MNQFSSQGGASVTSESPLLDTIFEQAKSRITDLRSQLDNPTAISSKEKRFIEMECARLNALARMQSRLNTYRQKHRESKRADKLAESNKSGNSTTLGDYLTASGTFRPNRDWQAHHIVCAKHSSHMSSRLKLFAAGGNIGINDPRNGCWLPRKSQFAKGTLYPRAVGHSYIHTDAYAEFVDNELDKVLMGEAREVDLTMTLLGIERKLMDSHQLDKTMLTDKGRADLMASV